MKFAWWRWACQVRDSEVRGGKRGWWEYLLYEHVVGMIFAGESDPVHWTSIPIVCPHLPATRLTDSLGKFLPLAQVRQPRWAGSSTHFRFLFAGLGSWDGTKSSKSRRECFSRREPVQMQAYWFCRELRAPYLQHKKMHRSWRTRMFLMVSKPSLFLSHTNTFWIPQYLCSPVDKLLPFCRQKEWRDESLFCLYMEDILLY